MGPSEMGELARQQPNFVNAAGGLRQAADQLELCPNLPSVDSGYGLIQRMDAVLASLGQLNQKVDTLDGKVDALDEKVTSLDGKVNSLDGKVNALDGKMNSLDGKVDALDGKVDTMD